MIYIFVIFEEEITINGQPGFIDTEQRAWVLGPEVKEALITGYEYLIKAERYTILQVINDYTILDWVKNESGLKAGKEYLVDEVIDGGTIIVKPFGYVDIEKNVDLKEDDKVVVINDKVVKLNV